MYIPRSMYIYTHTHTYIQDLTFLPWLKLHWSLFMHHHVAPPNTSCCSGGSIASSWATHLRSTPFKMLLAKWEEIVLQGGIFLLGQNTFSSIRIRRFKPDVNWRTQKIKGISTAFQVIGISSRKIKTYIIHQVLLWECLFLHSHLLLTYHLFTKSGYFINLQVLHSRFRGIKL